MATDLANGVMLISLVTEQVHTEVSLLWENRKVVFTEIAGGHVLSKCPKERYSPPWNIKFHYVFRGVTASL